MENHVLTCFLVFEVMNVKFVLIFVLYEGYDVVLLYSFQIIEEKVVGFEISGFLPTMWNKVVYSSYNLRSTSKH